MFSSVDGGCSIKSLRVQEEFMSAFGEQVATLRRQEQVQQELENCTEDMDRFAGNLLPHLLSIASQLITVLTCKACPGGAITPFLWSLGDCCRFGRFGAHDVP